MSDLSDNNACQNEQNVDELDVDDDISIENDDQNSSDDEEIEDDTTAELSPYYKVNCWAFSGRRWFTFDSNHFQIKKIVSKVRNSSTYRSEYTLMAKIIGVKPLMLIQDVTIRWNSTYLMLRRVLEMKKVSLKSCIQNRIQSDIKCCILFRLWRAWYKSVQFFKSVSCQLRNGH